MSKSSFALALLMVIAGAAPAAADSWEFDHRSRGCWKRCDDQPRLTYGRWPICRGESGREGINIRERDRSRCRVDTGWGDYEDHRWYECRCRQDWRGGNGDRWRDNGRPEHFQRRQGRD